MHKRILRVLLAVLIVLSLIPASALPSQAASNMTTGEECIQILKNMEGFVKYPMWDYSHYSVGYGSTCEEDDYPDGITLEEADALMREFLAGMEEELNRFANQHGIVFSQNQFDALMLFTYNCGTGWLYGNGEFRQAVLDNATGNDFIFESTQWSAAGGELLPSLVTRRLIESDMYLNGSYTNTKPSNYTYVLYDGNGGDSGARVQGYDYNLPAYPKAIPNREGYRFLGWYSAPEGGSWITKLSHQNGRKTLYAHWQGTDASVDNPCAASYKLTSDVLGNCEFYDAPNGTVAGTLSETDVAEIQGEFIDRGGIKWGRLPNNCWVKLGDPRIGPGEVTIEKTGVKVLVTGDYVNVRNGPGTQYDITAAVLEGDRIMITETVDVEGVLWGKFRGGWVCLQYTDYAGELTSGQVPETTEPETTVPETTEPETTPPETTAPGTETGQGTSATVISQTRLNIRSGAGTNFSRTGSYNPGQKIRILEQKTVGGVLWGRTDKGWVCMQYVQLEDVWTNESGIYGRVICTGNLNIRSGPGVAYPHVGGYPSGSRVEILEQTVVSGQKWGRTDKGWVCLTYVELDNSQTEKTDDEGVITADVLRVRKGPGTSNAIVSTYVMGEKVTILETTKVGITTWGRTDKGWISMDYVK